MINGERPFWLQPREQGNAVALVDARDHATTTHAALHARAVRCAELLQRPSVLKGVVALDCDRDADGIVAYLGCLLAGHTAFFMARGLEQWNAQWLETYQPEWIIAKPGPSTPGDLYRQFASLGAYQLFRRQVIDAPPPHPDLAILMSTSASTGSRKLARLSKSGIDANARQIVQALRISSGQRALVHLPFHYVYGLSVLNSHLAIGASLVLQQRSAASESFWQECEAAGVTTLPAVTHTFECMQGLCLGRESLPSLQKIQHSGERIPAVCMSWIRAQYARRGVDVYLMYGQTEASGRMAVLPCEQFDRAPSVGLPVAGGDIGISDEGEVIFRGPNVMLGYATSRACLQRGDDMQGRLATGDLGRLDAGGMLHLLGRKSRICKILGQRVNLDELEALVGGGVALAEVRGQVAVVCDAGRVEQLRGAVIRRVADLRLPPQAFSFSEVDHMPRGSTGKIDYAALRALLGA